MGKKLFFVLACVLSPLAGISQVQAQTYTGPGPQVVAGSCMGSKSKTVFAPNFTKGNWLRPSTMGYIGPGPMNAVRGTAKGRETFPGTNPLPLPKVTTSSASGGKGSCMKIEYPKGYWLTGYNALIPLPPSDRYYFEFDVTFDKDFYFKPAKMFGLAGWPRDPQTGARRFQPVSGGSAVDGNDGFSARNVFSTNGIGHMYAYFFKRGNGTSHQSGQWGGCGDDCYYNGSRAKAEVFKAGKTYRVAQQVVMNKPGVGNGILRVWLNGKLVVNLTDVNYRTVDWVKVDTLWMITFFGGDGPSWAPVKVEKANYCNFKVMTNPPYCK